MLDRCLLGLGQSPPTFSLGCPNEPSTDPCHSATASRVLSSVNMAATTVLQLVCYVPLRTGRLLKRGLSTSSACRQADVAPHLVLI